MAWAALRLPSTRVVMTVRISSTAAVVWFVSDANPYCSGQKLNIDGAGQASFR